MHWSALVSESVRCMLSMAFSTLRRAVVYAVHRRRKQEAAKKKEQAKILGKGRPKMSFKL